METEKEKGNLELGRVSEESGSKSENNSSTEEANDSLIEVVDLQNEEGEVLQPTEVIDTTQYVSERYEDDETNTSIGEIVK